MYRKPVLAVALIVLMTLVPIHFALAHDGNPPNTPQLEKPNDGQLHIHGVPEYPITIDGVAYEAEDISKFNGTPLHTYWTPDIETEGVIHFFTSKAGIEEHLRSRYSDYKGFPDPVDIDEARFGQVLRGPVSNWFKNTYYGGDYFGLNPGQGKWCLTGSWSNEISSIGCSSNGGWCYNYDYCFFTGSSLQMPNGHSYPTLSGLGWDDRINSVIKDT